MERIITLPRSTTYIEKQAIISKIEQEKFAFLMALLSSHKDITYKFYTNSIVAETYAYSFCLYSKLIYDNGIYNIKYHFEFRLKSVYKHLFTTILSTHYIGLVTEVTSFLYKINSNKDYLTETIKFEYD